MPHQAPLRPGDPRRVGRYRVAGRITGVPAERPIFLGTGPDGAEVSISMLDSDWANGAAARDRFTAEAAVAKRVPPFCAARILDAGLEGDSAFLVSEYIPGRSLAEVVTAGPVLGESELGPLAIGMATGLASVHPAGLVHGNFGPEYVIMTAAGPRVVEFGITPPYGTATPSADMLAWAQTVMFAAAGRPATSMADLDVLPHYLRELVLDCLSPVPSERPTARAAVLALIGDDPVSAGVLAEGSRRSVPGRAMGGAARAHARTVSAGASQGVAGHGGPADVRAGQARTGPAGAAPAAPSHAGAGHAQARPAGADPWLAPTPGGSRPADADRRRAGPQPAAGTRSRAGMQFPAGTQSGPRSVNEAGTPPGPGTGPRPASGPRPGSRHSRPAGQAQARRATPSAQARRASGDADGRHRTGSGVRTRVLITAAVLVVAVGAVVAVRLLGGHGSTPPAAASDRRPKPVSSPSRSTTPPPTPLTTVVTPAAFSGAWSGSVRQPPNDTYNVALTLHKASSSGQVSYSTTGVEPFSCALSLTAATQHKLTFSEPSQGSCTAGTVTVTLTSRTSVWYEFRGGGLAASGSLTRG
jgi:hypothetical protein